MVVYSFFFCPIHVNFVRLITRNMELIFVTKLNRDEKDTNNT